MLVSRLGRTHGALPRASPLCLLLPASAAQPKHPGLQAGTSAQSPSPQAILLTELQDVQPEGPPRMLLAGKVDEGRERSSLEDLTWVKSQLR